MINEEPPVIRKKLRRWFWPLLFAPAIVSALGTTFVALVIKGEDQLSWVILLNIIAALPVNGVCSAYCAVQVSRTRSEEARPAWLVLGTLGFFGMNVVLAFGGCTAGVLLSENLH